MTVATSSDSTHSVSCLSRGLALLGLSPTSKRAPLSEKNLNLHNGSDASSGSGSETSSTESWFTVEKPEKTAKIDGVEKHPASDSASQLVVETYEEDLPEYTEKSAIAVAVRYKNRELFFIVKPTTRIKTIKRAFARNFGSKGELRPNELQLNYCGRKLRDRMTVAECGMEDGDEILCMIDFDYIPMAG